MTDIVLDVLANSSPLPIAIIAESGALIVANRALRLLVDEDDLREMGYGRDLSEGRRVIVRTRGGGPLALEVVPVPDGTRTWILRGEDPACRYGLAEAGTGFVHEANAVGSVLDVHLRIASQRAREQDRSVALILLRVLDIDRLAPAVLPYVDEAMDMLDRRLAGNLRAADRLLPQDDVTRAVVAVVGDGDGAAILAHRLAGIFSQPVMLHGVERVFGVRIGIAHTRGFDVELLEKQAKEALRQAEASPRTFLSIIDACAA
jgi:GGDEF domain-containing protein